MEASLAKKNNPCIKTQSFLTVLLETAGKTANFKNLFNRLYQDISGGSTHTIINPYYDYSSLTLSILLALADGGAHYTMYSNPRNTGKDDDTHNHSSTMPRINKTFSECLALICSAGCTLETIGIPYLVDSLLKNMDIIPEENSLLETIIVLSFTLFTAGINIWAYKVSYNLVTDNLKHLQNHNPSTPLLDVTEKTEDSSKTPSTVSELQCKIRATFNAISSITQNTNFFIQSPRYISPDLSINPIVKIFIFIACSPLAAAVCKVKFKTYSFFTQTSKPQQADPETGEPNHKQCIEGRREQKKHEQMHQHKHDDKHKQHHQGEHHCKKKCCEQKKCKHEHRHQHGQTHQHQHDDKRKQHQQNGHHCKTKSCEHKHEQMHQNEHDDKHKQQHQVDHAKALRRDASLTTLSKCLDLSSTQTTLLTLLFSNLIDNNDPFISGAKISTAIIFIAIATFVYPAIYDFNYFSSTRQDEHRCCCH